MQCCAVTKQEKLLRAKLQRQQAEDESGQDSKDSEDEELPILPQFSWLYPEGESTSAK